MTLRKMGYLLFIALGVFNWNSHKIAFADQESDIDSIALASSFNDLGLALLPLEAPSQNVVFSPFSIANSLAQLRAGADGETLKQLSKILRVPDELESDQKFHGAAASLAAQIQSPFVQIANGLWHDANKPINSSFSNFLSSQYGSRPHSVNFADKTNTKQQINSWASDKTQGKIKNVTLPDNMDGAQFVITSAAHLEASWATKFNPEETANQAFYLNDSALVDVAMMHQAGLSARYVAAEEYNAIQLPYEGLSLAMLILVPRQGHLKELESQLTSQKLQQISAQMRTYKIDLSMPKFAIQNSINGTGHLQSLGLTDLFTPGQANLTKITNAFGAHISDIRQEAMIQTDEKGTKAAAVTAATGMSCSAEPHYPAATLSIDRPFVFLIQDQKTKAIIFMGRIVNPNH